jgi:hypothetical protein
MGLEDNIARDKYARLRNQDGLAEILEQLVTIFCDFPEIRTCPPRVGAHVWQNGDLR